MIASDASPLISLAKAGKLYLLRELFERVLIDEEDAREVARAVYLKGRGSLYVLRESIEKDLISKEESIETLDIMIKGGFRISTRIYAKFLEDLK
jgi:predicted nucleic acid-binding protein